MGGAWAGQRGKHTTPLQLSSSLLWVPASVHPRHSFRSGKGPAPPESSPHAHFRDELIVSCLAPPPLFAQAPLPPIAFPPPAAWHLQRFSSSASAAFICAKAVFSTRRSSLTVNMRERQCHMVGVQMG